MTTKLSVLATLQQTFPDLYPSSPAVQKADKEEDDEAGSPVPNGETPLKRETTLERRSDDQYGLRLNAISDKYDRVAANAVEVGKYLVAATEEAKEAEERALAQADEEFTPAWRNTGLPMRPSHLQLDGGRLAGEKLVNPGAIMSQFHTLRQREVLMPPETRLYSDTQADPHHLTTTKNTQVRLEGSQHQLSTIRDTVKSKWSWYSLPPEEVEARMAATEALRKARARKMTPAQWEAEQRIIKRMTQKLSFLRNPRYKLPPAVELLAAQLHQRQEHTPTWRLKDPPANKLPTIKNNLTSIPGCTFIVEPPEVVFNDYEVGGVYEMSVLLRNISSMSRNVRVFPPRSQYFHTSLLRFPAATGVVAPGMAAELTIRFCPDSLADFEDAFAVDHNLDRFTVRLLAQRSPPSLTLAQEIDLGEVVVGNRQVVSVPFKNQGGRGRFRLIPADLWPADLAAASLGAASLGCFEVWPCAYELAPGDSAELNISFEPEEVGVQQQELVIVCDNCQVKTLTLRATSTDINVHLQDIDGCSYTVTDLDSPVWFGEVVPGSSSVKQLTVVNTTTLPFPFQWCITNQPQTRHAVRSEKTPASQEVVRAARYRGTPLESTRDPDIISRTVDLVALGISHTQAFKVHPSQGVLAPGASHTFTLEFMPPDVHEYTQWAQLKVDKSVPGQPPKPPDLLVVEVGMQGLGSHLDLHMAPPRIVLPGRLAGGQVVLRQVTLHNPSAAPAHFAVEGGKEGLGDGGAMMAVYPQSGVVPPYGDLELQVRFTAPQHVGPVACQMMVNCQHGRSLPLDLLAQVGPSRVALVTCALDYGLVRFGAKALLPLVLRNTSPTSPASFSLTEVNEAGEELPHDGSSSYLIASPSVAELSPSEEMEVQVELQALVAGQHRSALRVVSEAGTEVVQVFAVVVIPQFILDRTRLDLGRAFFGYPVKQSVRLTNLALLPAGYAWGVEGDSHMGELRIRPKSGVLGPGESAEISMKFTPKVVGPCTLYGVCDVEGSADPIGFRFHADISPLDVVCEVLTPQQFEDMKNQPIIPVGVSMAEEGEEEINDYHPEICAGMSHLPPELLARLSSHRRASTKPRNPEATFGVEVPLGETRRLIVVLHNKTALEARVMAAFDYFGVEDLSALAGGVKSFSRQGSRGSRRPQKGLESGTGTLAKPGLIKLSAGHEHSTPFMSDEGVRMMATRRMIQEAEKVLGSKGLALSLAPSSSYLQPWSKLALEFTAYNDMCGDYFDNLHLQVGDLPEFRVPVRIGVVGTPLVVQSERVLIAGVKERSWRMNIDMGQVPLGVTVERVFHVFNTGSLDMHVSWTFMRFVDDEDEEGHDDEAGGEGEQPLPPVSIEVEGETADGLQPSPPPPPATAPPPGTAPPATSASPPSTARSPPPTARSRKKSNKQLIDVMLRVEVNGIKLVIDKHSEPAEEPFFVTPAQQLVPGSGSVKFTVTYLSTAAGRPRGYLQGVTRVQQADERDVELRVWPAAGPDGEEGVKCLISGSFHRYAGRPPLPLQPLRVDLAALSAPCHLELDEEGDRLEWSVMAPQDPDTSDSFRHSATLVNRGRCPLVAELSVEGPWRMVSTVPSWVQEKQQMLRPETGLLALSSPLHLPPEQSVDVALAFTPPPARHEADDYELTGRLVATFANKDVQVFPLKGSMEHPYVELKPGSRDFGSVHVKVPKTLTVLLSNPSRADAVWALCPASQAASPPSPEQVEQACRDPMKPPSTKFGPFTVSPSCGRLPGRGLRSHSSVTLNITYSPKEAKSHQEAVQVAVYRGRGCQLQMQGQGSVLEGDEYQAHLTQL